MNLFYRRVMPINLDALQTEVDALSAYRPGPPPNSTPLLPSILDKGFKGELWRLGTAL
jgi:hypothetical protein